jgi:hypothetical protein
VLAEQALHHGRSLAICKSLPGSKHHAALSGVAGDMTGKQRRNTAASVRDRLLRLAKQRGDDFQLILTRYGLERFLYRLSQSEYRDRFVLKGAMLFALWSPQAHRAMRDVDFLGFGDSDSGTSRNLSQLV